MRKSVADYLRDFLQELTDVADFTTEGRAAFMNDIRTQKAVIRSYEVIGEIAKRLPPELSTANPQIDWRKLTMFRDFLAHNYEMVVLRNVWAAVEDLPRLRAQVEALLLTVEDDADA